MLLQCLLLLECRSLRGSIFSRSQRGNPWIIVGLLAVLSAQLAFVYMPLSHTVFGTAPLDLSGWGRAILVAAPVIPVLELIKALARRRL